jgi:hypothetical protein
MWGFAVCTTDTDDAFPVELPETAWQGTHPRGPSTHPRVGSSARLSLRIGQLRVVPRLLHFSAQNNP